MTWCPHSPRRLMRIQGLPRHQQAPNTVAMGHAQPQELKQKKHGGTGVDWSTTSLVGHFTHWCAASESAGWFFCQKSDLQVNLGHWDKSGEKELGEQVPYSF